MGAVGLTDSNIPTLTTSSYPLGLKKDKWHQSTSFQFAN